MPQSNFKRKAKEFGAKVERHSCGQTLECASEQELAMKRRIQCRFCSNPPVAFDKIRVPKKATTLKEHNSYEAERIRKVHNQYLSSWINIITPEHNQEATMYLQELTSTLLIQRLIQVHL